MTPRELDWVVNGFPVYINRRPDGSVYATIHDFRRFNVVPLTTVRISLEGLTKSEDALTHPSVMAVIKGLSNGKVPDAR